MRLKLAAPYNRAAGVHDGIASAKLGRAGVVSGVGAMPVASEVDVIRDFKDIFPLGSIVIPCVLVAIRYLTR